MTTLQLSEKQMRALDGDGDAEAATPIPTPSSVVESFMVVAETMDAVTTQHAR